MPMKRLVFGYENKMCHGELTLGKDNKTYIEEVFVECVVLQRGEELGGPTAGILLPHKCTQKHRQIVHKLLSCFISG